MGFARDEAHSWRARAERCADEMVAVSGPPACTHVRGAGSRVPLCACACIRACGTYGTCAGVRACAVGNLANRVCGAHLCSGRRVCHANSPLLASARRIHCIPAKRTLCAVVHMATGDAEALFAELRAASSDAEEGGGSDGGTPSGCGFSFYYLPTYLAMRHHARPHFGLTHTRISCARALSRTLLASAECSVLDLDIADGVVDARAQLVEHALGLVALHEALVARHGTQRREIGVFA